MLCCAGRSGPALNHRIHIGAGVIDRDYRGELKILLLNFADTDFHVRTGDRIAQLICEKIEYPIIVEAETMSLTERADRGFGSS